MTYYTYLWLREDGTPYYVGKGKGRRCFYLGSHLVKQPSDLSRIIIQEHESEEEAYEAEIFLISLYGRIDLGTGCLRNRANGGKTSNGNKGKKLSPEWRKKIADSLVGNKRTLGFKQSEETRALWRKQRKGHPNYRPNYRPTEETKALISKTLSGRIFSEDTLRKMSESAKVACKTRKHWDAPEGHFSKMNLRANHLRHHERRGIVNEACALCRKQPEIYP